MIVVEGGSDWRTRLMTTEPHPAGHRIATVTDYRVMSTPNRLSIQVGRDRHIEDLGMIAYYNHSCRPSTFFDTDDLTLVALRDIAAGEELTCFYPSTEWEMYNSFECACGAAECIGTVTGAKHLPWEVLDRYPLSPHIRELAGEVSVLR